MAIDQSPKKGSAYDDDWKPKPEVGEAEDQSQNSLANQNGQTSNGSDKSLTTEQLAAAEQAGDPQASQKDNSAASGTGSSESDNNFGFRDEGQATGRVKKLLGINKDKKKSSTGRKLAKRAGLGGSVGVIAILILMLIFLSSLKVVHFSEILSATGYARFRGILIERTTQDIFDASVVRGDGEATLRGRSIIDKIKMRNVENQLSVMGREDKLRFNYKDGSLDSVKVGEKTVSLDKLTSDLGYGDKFSDIKGSFFDRINPQNSRKVATVRQQFYAQLGAAMDETAGFEARYIRNGLFNRIADNVGFSWSRWRQAARGFLGLSPVEADIENKVKSAEEVSGENDITKTDIEQLDVNQEAQKNAEKLKAFLEKNGGEFDPVKFEQSVLEDTKSGAKIQEAAGDVAMVTLIMSLACMANQAASRVPEIAQKNEEAAVREGLQLQAANSQIKSGKVTAPAVAAESHRLDGGDKSSYYNYATGRPVNSATDVPKIKPSFDPQFIDIIKRLTSPSQLGLAGQLAHLFPGGGALTDRVDKEFCSALLSPEGAVTAAALEVVTTAVVGFLTAGGGAAAEQAGGRAAAGIFLRELATATFSSARELVSTKSIATLGAIGLYGVGLELSVRALSGSSFSGAESGAGYVERSAVGTNVAQDRQLRSVGGRRLTKEEAKSVDSRYIKQARAKYQNSGTFARYLGKENPYSLVGMVAAKTPGSFSNVGSMFSGFLGNISKIFQPSTLKNIFGGAFATANGNIAYAAEDAGFDPYFGNEQWGFSADEQEKMRSDPSFSIAHLDEYISEEQVKQYDETIGNCFNPSRSQYEVENDTNCAPDKLSGDDVLRYRLYNFFDSYIADDLSQDYKSLPDSESQVAEAAAPAGSDIVGNPYQNSESVACASGTSDLGVHDAYSNGTLIKMRLCGLSNMHSTSEESTPGTKYYIQNANGQAIVNSRVSGAWFTLIKDAATAKIALAANSSFRTMAHQQDIWNGNPNPESVAPPGKSSHQAGVAIDFANMGGDPASGRTCANRQTWDSPAWRWLRDNAKLYGFKQYSNEAWHWDALPTDNRC